MKFFSHSLLVLSFFIISIPLSAQTFFYKENAEVTQPLATIGLDFLIDSNSSIELQKSENFFRFTAPDGEMREGKILKRELTETEKLVTTGLWVLTGFAMLTFHDAYDLGADLKLVSQRGLLFFIFPFESHFLYRTCAGVDHLVAVSSKPSEQTTARLMPLDELHRVCDPQDDES